MRKIKFRGLSIETDEWVYGNLIQGQDFALIVSPLILNEDDGTWDTEWEHQVYTDTICQYTEMDDDDKNEIYPADIVEIRLPWETKTSHKSYVYHTKEGFMVDSHPAHKSLGLNGPRHLVHYIVNGECKKLGDYITTPDILEVE